MAHMVSIIISYGAFLALIMPASGEGIVATLAAFVIGNCWMLYKKTHKIQFCKNKQYPLIFAAILIVIYFGWSFYIQWLPSSKMQTIANMLYMSVDKMLLIGTLLLSGLSVYSVYVVLQAIIKNFFDINLKNDLVKIIISCVVASAVTVMLAQVMVDTKVFSMGCFKFAWGVLIVFAAIIFVYCLFGRIVPAILLGSGLFMVISTVNVYVFKFRSRLFEPVDIFSAGTAMNVAENYSLFPIPPVVLIGWGIFAAILIVFGYSQEKSKWKISNPKRYLLLVVSAISTVAIFFYTTNLKTYHWQKEGAYFNGYILDFVSKIKEITAPEPDNYSMELIDKLSDQYSVDNKRTEESTEYPHIIVIMDEAFSDLSVTGEILTNMEVMPFISSLKENTISGYALSSVYGGNTANSEYEFLTGNSMAWLSPNAVPYQQYIRTSTYSMVSHLKSLYNYRCVAMHPFYSSGWNRPATYKYLGFDECYFIDDFPQLNYVRDFISDQEMFEFLIKTYEEQKDQPLFIFGVTMQNHGGYTYTGENYSKTISLEKYADAYPEVEQYLSLVYETDKAVEYLITYFQNTDDKVVIAFFGDHQPKINEKFYEVVSGTTADSLDEQQIRYKVPFFVWANYDIEEEYVECTSLNYLSSYVYNASGIVMPPYNRFLQEMETVIPSINANGFYSLSSGHYLPFDEANEDERTWLELYEVLQYNSIFDLKKQNKTLFTTSE